MSEAICEITYLSEIDRTMQPALFAPASGSDPMPLVVALHTWSCTRHEPEPVEYFRLSAERNWHCIYPEFRGPNWTPDACGSDKVISDLECAVRYVCENYAVDTGRIYLVGGSGGGHASLMMAARRPEIWSAVSSWCPISDIVKWHNFSDGRGVDNCYAKNIRSVCGGDPREDAAAAADAAKRSPVSYLADASGKVIVDIGTGIHDGYTGSVPISHTLEAFNLLAAEDDRISEADIEYMVKNQAVPEALKFKGEDPAYGAKKVLFRRESGLVRVTIFEGGHDVIYSAAFGFLERQKRHAAPVWSSGSGNSAPDAEGLSR